MARCIVLQTLTQETKILELVENVDSPAPEELRVNELELKQQQADELIESTGMDTETFTELLFKKMHVVNMEMVSDCL